MTRSRQSGSSSPEGGRRPNVIVAIDGPAGSGKSTVAAGLAQRLSVPHVDTGAYYRAATLAVLRAGSEPTDAAACGAVVAASAISRSNGRTLLDGEDVEEEIRGGEVTAAVSAVSAHTVVRAVLLPMQRGGLSPGGGVVEGRDAGTVVVPDAPLKVWLTASPAERAARRAAQLGQHHREDVAVHLADLERRDLADAARMVRAVDVVEVDTTGRSIAWLVEHLAVLARSAAGKVEEQH